jgi:hypothetical protein
MSSLKFKLGFAVVLASGEVAIVNESSHPDCMIPSQTCFNAHSTIFIVFWALRGGGAGSWGVVLSVILRTFPSFPATVHSADFTISSAEFVPSVLSAHAKHIFDLDAHRAGQYYMLFKDGWLGSVGFKMSLTTVLPNVSLERAHDAMQPLVQAMIRAGAILNWQTKGFSGINLLLRIPDDNGGINTVLGSRLVPAVAYKDSPAEIGRAHKDLLDLGVTMYESLRFASLPLN